MRVSNSSSTNSNPLNSTQVSKSRGRNNINSRRIKKKKGLRTRKLTPQPPPAIFGDKCTPNTDPHELLIGMCNIQALPSSKTGKISIGALPRWSSPLLAHPRSSRSSDNKGASPVRILLK